MDSSPYLKAIQNVGGSTPGEKYKTLNLIARKIIAASDGKKKSIKIKSSLELPEILIPFVKVEVGKILQQPNLIVEALTSDDNSIFHRALRAKWFFAGSHENITNNKYFNDCIFGYISLKRRHKLIKMLSINLAANEKDVIAEKFYETLWYSYGEKISEPLLLACSEPFICSQIVKKKLFISVKIINKLYCKYPYVTIAYLRSKEPNNKPDKQNAHVNELNYYSEFLPRLLKNDIHIYIELIEKFPELRKKLSRKYTDIFLKQATEDLIKNPNIFAPIMNLKSITSKLTKEQFKLFFRNLFPTNSTEKYSEFSFMKMYNYLEYYPSDEKVSFILSTFEEVYDESFLDQDDLIGPEILRLLSPENRVEVAKKKLEKDPNWYTSNNENLEKSWRCYLQIDESISIIKDEIYITSEVKQRRELLKQLIYSCKVNNDEDALLKVLEYMEATHKYERGYVLLRVFERLLNDFQIENLSIQHWEILDYFIKLLHIKDELLLIPHIAVKLIIGKIHFCLINNLPITEAIEYLFDIEMNKSYHDWNILKHNSEYERKCLEEFINIAPMLYPKDKRKTKLVNSFLNAMNNFNERHMKNNNRIKPMTVENYLWLMTEIPRLVNNDHDDCAAVLRMNLKKSDPNLYHAWVTEKEKDGMINLDSNKEFNDWIKNPDKITIHWEKYLDECKNDINKKYAQRFIKNCRWHQNLPIKFVEKCLKEVTENGDPNALIVLALLYDGSTFERIINPFLPMILSIDIKSKDAKKNYLIMKSIPKALSLVNPPVSLNITSRFCNSDRIHMIDNWITILNQQTPIDKLISFAIELRNQPDSVVKHFIKIFETATHNQYVDGSLINLWRIRKGYTIRSPVFDIIFNLFLNNPKFKTWRLLRECMEGLNTDNKEQFASLCCIEKIPNEYVVMFVRKLFLTLRNCKTDDNTVDIEFTQSFITKLLRIPNNISVFFPERFHRDILLNYFGNSFLPMSVLEAALYYLVHSYINLSAKNLKPRLNFYTKLFSGLLKILWNICNPRKPHIYPANYMVDSLMTGILFHITDDEIRRKFIIATLNAFLKVKTPIQAPVFYSYYMFVAIYHGNQMSRAEYVEEIKKIIPIFINSFSTGFFFDLGKILSQCLESFWNDAPRSEVNFEIVEGLLELNDEHATILAAAIPIHDYIKQNERYMKILQTFCNRKNQAVSARVLMDFNRRGYITD